jgi:hypothetical protein
MAVRDLIAHDGDLAGIIICEGVEDIAAGRKRASNSCGRVLLDEADKVLAPFVLGSEPMVAFGTS